MRTLFKTQLIELVALRQDNFSDLALMVECFALQLLNVEYLLRLCAYGPDSYKEVTYINAGESCAEIAECNVINTRFLAEIALSLASRNKELGYK